ncbi:MAG: hypothetical protein QOD06_1852 [Candidatus Binatota bacterium]|nr:hypothetical protein [Candidatus Binatota bacterium]
MGALFVIGLLMGVRHAFEADHVAAVAALATRSSSLRETAWMAAAWGIGHAVMLLGVGCALIALDATLPEPVARGLEVAVGGVLVALGIDVLRRVWRKRVHVHAHEHPTGVRHLHIHVHDQGVDHVPSDHRHAHAGPLPSRALLVGGLHGLAGSGALVLLSVDLSGARAAATLAAFGAGTIVGMLAFSIAISLPLRLSAKRLTHASNALEGALGLVSIAVGGWVGLHAAFF